MNVQIYLLLAYLTSLAAPIATKGLPQGEHHFSACGKLGTIFSPGWPQNYPPNIHHTWIITSDVDLNFQFTYFDLEYKESCLYDYLRVEIDYKLYRRYCGDHISHEEYAPEDFTVNAGSRVKICFDSDDSTNYSGFKLHIKGISTMTPCPTFISTTTPSVGTTPVPSTTKLAVPSTTPNPPSTTTSSMSTTTTMPTTTHPSTTSVRDPSTTTEDAFDYQQCGVPWVQPELSQRIVGGQEAVAGSWPWQVDVTHYGEMSHHYAGGTLVSANHVVTAAHLFRGRDKEQFRLIMGKHSQLLASDWQQERGISSIHIHQNFTSASIGGYDVAILTLDSPVTMTRHVLKACLQEEEESIPATTICVATGWGDTGGTGDDTVLNQVSLPVLSNALCNLEAFFDGRITDTMMCAGYPDGGKDACQGDSGGPLSCKLKDRYYLGGIRSWGLGCGLATKPGVYTKTSAVISWIKSVIDY